MPPRRRKPRPPRRYHPPKFTKSYPLSALTGVEFNVGGWDIPDTAGNRLARACIIIGERAKELGGRWSLRVPLMMYTFTLGNVGYVVNYAPPGRPAELRLNHPLFGNREYWYGPPGPPFLAPAADEKVDDAMREYAKTIDDKLREHRWR